MALKKVKYNLPAVKIDMGGFPVKQPFPTNKVANLDPFLLLHHARTKPIFNRPARIQGIGPHPHRGFSPVTFVIEGGVHHRDSFGNNQESKAGDVQWMHAGAGIIHSERPTSAVIEKKQIQEIVQLWINSPAVSKMIPPTYQYLASENIPTIDSEDQKSILRIITGEYQGIKGPAKSQSNNLIIWSIGTSGSQSKLKIKEGESTSLYLIKGDISLKGYGVIDPETLIHFESEGTEIEITSKSNFQFLLLSGEPIHEPIAQQGPFVMNTQTEILEAMRDYQMGKMGVLIEE